MANRLCTPTQIQQLVKAMHSLYPQDRTELNYTNSFELLCAVVLSAQTTDKAVNKVTPQLFQRFPTITAMSQAKVADIQSIIRTIGLYKNKAKYLQQLSLELLQNFAGQVPHTREELITLSGVGRKTANVVLANAFDIPAFAVDTHVERVCKRFHFVENNATVLQVEEKMTSILPSKMWREAHHAILLFGRYQCVARPHDHEICESRLQTALEHLND